MDIILYNIKCRFSLIISGTIQEKLPRYVDAKPFEIQANIADFSKDGDQPYFMQDTIHMGWKGWVAFDRVVDSFVSNPTPAPSYKLNDRFYSKDWSGYTGTPSQFK